MRVIAIVTLYIIGCCSLMVAYGGNQINKIFFYLIINLVGIAYCNATFDSFLCWPPTPAGRSTSQNCPVARLSDTTRQAFRRCGKNGLWLGRRANESDLKGWTNYTPCFPTEVQKLLVKVNDDENAQLKFEIAQRTRYLEIVGFSISLIALLLSLYIFTHFKSLRNSRTNIHRNLFSAMTIQVIIRLIVYIDQAIIRDKPNINVKGIDDMPYICEVSYILLEYAISSMFMWMFVEGLFLHNMVTANVLRDRTSPALFLGIGWGLPVVVTALWAIVTAIHYGKDEVKGCWYGYNFLVEYWLLQGPRLAVILINLMFLLNIMRVLITKLNATENNEMTKVKKAARAALVLLPLLGITNILNMIEPVDGAVWKFALWCYVTHFLRSFQGFGIALIYCFTNGEVNEVVRKSYRDRQEERQYAQRARRIAERNARRTWLHRCLLAVIVTPVRKLIMWIRGLCPIHNAVHTTTQDAENNIEIAPETSDDIRRRNYADPTFQACMEEIRLENNTLITLVTVRPAKKPSNLILLRVKDQSKPLTQKSTVHGNEELELDDESGTIDKVVNSGDTDPTNIKVTDKIEDNNDDTDESVTYTTNAKVPKNNEDRTKFNKKYTPLSCVKNKRKERAAEIDTIFTEEDIMTEENFELLQLIEANLEENESKKEASLTTVETDMGDNNEPLDNINKHDKVYTTMHQLFEYYDNVSEDDGSPTSSKLVLRCSDWDGHSQDIVIHNAEDSDADEVSTYYMSIA